MSWKVWDFTFQTITAAFKKIHFGTPRRYRIRGWKLYIIHQVLQTYFSQRPAVTLPENNSKNPLEMDGCKISFLLGWPIIRSMGYLELTSETKWEKTCAYNIYIYIRTSLYIFIIMVRTVSFREGIQKHHFGDLCTFGIALVTIYILPGDIICLPPR